MTGIWSLSDSRWRPEEPVSFQQEKELHDLIEQAPELLPLAGAPRFVTGHGKWQVLVDLSGRSACIAPTAHND